jgi:hypothetical protein
MRGQSSMALFDVKTHRPPGFSEHHADVPALVMGNGPSLARVDFCKLENFRTFGMNAAYRYWETIGCWPDYYACLDGVVGESHIDAIRDLIANSTTLGIQLFLLRFSTIKRLGALGRSHRVCCYEKLLADGVLPKLRDVTTGSHTMLWAQSLGYSTILLAGVDCDYQEIVQGAAIEGDHLVIKETAPNPNYFFEGYQKPGDRFNQPNLTEDMHVQSWRNCVSALRPETRVVNLNPRSRVDAFPYNFSTGSMLTPGLIEQSPTTRSDDSARNSYQCTALMNKTIAKCRRYCANIDGNDIRDLLRRRLEPSASPEVKAWRICAPIRIVERYKIDESARPLLVIKLVAIGKVSLPSNYAYPVSNDGDLDGLHVAVYAQADVPRLSSLILNLHRETGVPTFGASALDFLHALTSMLSSFLPWRVRAKDWASLLRRFRPSDTAVPAQSKPDGR